MANIMWSNNIQDAFAKVKVLETDMRAHCEMLNKLAANCDSIVEFGVRHGISTTCFLAGTPGWVQSYDLQERPAHNIIKRLVEQDKWKTIYGDIKKTAVGTVPECDMIFFDSEHSHDQITFELQFAHLAKKYLIFHDTTTFWDTNPKTKQPGIGKAIKEYINNHPEWALYYETSKDHGLQVYERQS